MSISIDGHSLTLDHVTAVARRGAMVAVAPEAIARAKASRATIERLLASGRSIYGVNTGFGKLASVRIPDDRLRDLQRNLIVSHAAGVGDPLPPDIVRAMMLLRANVLLRATSGVRPVVAERLIALLNAGILPVVPEQGSVGASGDLAPLAHLALALLGEGEVDVQRSRLPAKEALDAAGIALLTLEPKEGLAFVNGTQAQTAVLALVLADAERLWHHAHVGAAMSVEALRGTPDPFDPRIHAARPHPGQVRSAALLADLLAGSALRESHRENDPRVQDAYSLRCTPQVYGPVADMLAFARQILDTELNASTDNPLLLGEDVVSGGNFHGQYVAMALDTVTVALTTLAGLAERRIERLLNPDLSEGLPAFLAASPGLESGFMMVQVTAAALVAESRTLCMPASVQSIPTGANQEDWVPMGMVAAFKARRVLANAEHVVAAELLCAAQALGGATIAGPTPAPKVVAAWRAVREVVAPLTADRAPAPDLVRLRARLAGSLLA
ncbi:MAG: histidine ammonia-lyase [Gemmatimonadales bacterium]